MDTVLTKTFFERDPFLVARDLLGIEIGTVTGEGLTSGIIVETEAYGAADEASHSFSGMTKRNTVMFGEAGLCYVYISYGIHHCVNVVTESASIGSAVLIRAIQPLQGIDIMTKRRGVSVLKNLTSGPGKLCQALGISLSCNGEDFLSSGKIFLKRQNTIPETQVSYSPRIGITKATELPWRVFVKDSEFVSRNSSRK